MSVPATATGVVDPVATKTRRRLPRYWILLALLGAMLALSLLLHLEDG